MDQETIDLSNTIAVASEQGHSDDFPGEVSFRSDDQEEIQLKTQQQEQQQHQHEHHHHQKHWSGHWAMKSLNGRAVWAGRIIFLCFLWLLAFLLGYLTFSLLDEAEHNLTETQFASIAQRAAVEAKEALLSRRWAGVALSNVVAELYPNADEWPYVEWLNFEGVVGAMLETSHSNDMGFIPFVKPDERQEFESFAQNVYQKLGFPEQAGVTDPELGFGIWARNQTFNPPKKYLDTTAVTPYESRHEILAPVFRTDEGFHSILLFNPHSQSFTGQAIDLILDCSYEREEEFRDQVKADKANGVALPTMPPHHCGVITDVFKNVKLDGRWSVATFFPIYPVQDPLTVVGYISSIFVVDELLKNVFGSDISGIDAVFISDGRSVTFTIVNGVAQYVGEGELYDPKYESQKIIVELLDAELFAKVGGRTKSFLFQMTPNDDFDDVYETNNPIRASVVVVGSIVLTILIFILYDFFVRREFHAKRELLEARRQFMRFVSHEVRTPLNAVSMGLDLMQSEIARTLGYDSHTAYRASPEFERQARSDLGSSSRNSSHQDLTALLDSSMRSASVPSTTVSSNAHQQQAASWFRLTQEIQDNAQGAVDILNDLLNYDKLEQGTFTLGLEVIDIWELMETAILEFKLPASSKNVELGVAFVSNAKEMASAVKHASSLSRGFRAMKVIGDSVRLTQVLRNLMSNALKFTPFGGSISVEAKFCQLDPYEINPTPKKSTSKRYLDPSCNSEESILLENGSTVSGSREGFIKIQVKDSGAGMSKEQLNNLFQEGVQFNANELQAGGGSGLGLYIAKGIVNQHEGSLAASSPGIGQGTTFELVLPLWKLLSNGNSESSNLVDSQSRTIESTFSNLSSSSSTEQAMTQVRRVLVVDDVKSNRKLLRRLLENKGLDCVEAENGQEAVDTLQAALAKSEPFESILMDFEMPIMDGPTAAKHIREILNLRTVNIVGITGNVLPDDVQHFKDCGANDILSKPIRVPDLLASWMESGLQIAPKSR